MKLLVAACLVAVVAGFPQNFAPSNFGAGQHTSHSKHSSGSLNNQGPSNPISSGNYESRTGRAYNTPETPYGPRDYGNKKPQSSIISSGNYESRTGRAYNTPETAYGPRNYGNKKPQSSSLISSGIHESRTGRAQNKPVNPYGPKAYGMGLNNPYALPPNQFVMNRALSLANAHQGLLVRVDVDGDVTLTDRFGAEVENLYDNFGRDLTELYDL